MLFFTYWYSVYSLPVHYNQKKISKWCVLNFCNMLHVLVLLIVCIWCAVYNDYCGLNIHLTVHYSISMCIFALTYIINCLSILICSKALYSQDWWKNTVYLHKRLGWEGKRPSSIARHFVSISIHTCSRRYFDMETEVLVVLYRKTATMNHSGLTDMDSWQMCVT